MNVAHLEMIAVNAVTTTHQKTLDSRGGPLRMNWILAMEPLLISLLGLLLIAVGAWIVYRLSYEMWLSGTEQGFSAGYHRCREDWAEEIDAGCKVLGWDRADEEIEDRMMNGCA